MAFGEIIGWVTSNYLILVEAYLALVGFASVVVKLTPTLKDDNILKGVIKFMGRILALNRK